MIRRKRSDSDVNDIVKKPSGTTKGKKNIIIDQNTNGLYFIRFEGGGQLPPSLAGKYSRHEIAQYAIDFYLAGK